MQTIPLHVVVICHLAKDIRVWLVTNEFVQLVMKTFIPISVWLSHQSDCCAGQTALPLAEIAEPGQA